MKETEKKSLENTLMRQTQTHVARERLERLAQITEPITAPRKPSRKILTYVNPNAGKSK